MLTTAVSILGAIALLMPGFVIAELSLVRAARASRSDLELALRAVTYAFAVHLALGYWTVCLVDRVGSADNIPDHLGAISLYGAVGLLALPIALGMLLNTLLARAELAEGPPRRVAAAFGAGEARDAFDYAFQRGRDKGAYVIVELVGHSDENPRLVGGIFGRRSAIGQTPQPHDIYLEALCTVAVDETGARSPHQRFDPPRGVYVPADQIARIDLVPEAESVPAATIQA
jgi:hypothetical protein